MITYKLYRNIYIYINAFDKRKHLKINQKLIIINDDIKCLIIPLKIITKKMISSNIFHTFSDGHITFTFK